MPGLPLKIGHDRFFLHPSQFTHSCLSSYHIRS
jgi:hypothetical protein